MLHSQINLARLVKAKTPQRKTVALRPIIPTLTQQRELGTIYMAIVRAWRTAIAELILPMYAARLAGMVHDDATTTLAHALGTAEGGVSRLIAEANAKTNAWAVRVEKWHLGQWTSAVNSGAGIQVAGVLLSHDAADQIALALERNASLITNLSADMQKRVEQSVWSAVANQTPRRELAAQLQESLDIGRTRALNIAVDQTNKLSGDLDRLRQTQAGITSYEWVHSGKVHYRPLHKARNGKVFKWSDPPADGHPRTLPFCGCSAKALLGDEPASAPSAEGATLNTAEDVLAAAEVNQPILASEAGRIGPVANPASGGFTRD